MEKNKSHVVQNCVKKQNRIKTSYTKIKVKIKKKNLIREAFPEENASDGCVH